MAIDSEAEGAPIINDNIDEDTNTVVSLLTVEEAVVEDGGQYTCSDANDYFNRDSANVAITEAAGRITHSNLGSGCRYEGIKIGSQVITYHTYPRAKYSVLKHTHTLIYVP